MIGGVTGRDWEDIGGVTGRDWEDTGGVTGRDWEDIGGVTGRDWEDTGVLTGRLFPPAGFSPRGGRGGFGDRGGRGGFRGGRGECQPPIMPSAPSMLILEPGTGLPMAPVTFPSMPSYFLALSCFAQ